MRGDFTVIGTQVGVCQGHAVSAMGFASQHFSFCLFRNFHTATV
jgi:hypothetical protein